MAVKAPRDTYNVVWLIFFMLGLGTLLPWNFFMTATLYFTSRLKEAVPAPVPGSGPVEPGDVGLNVTGEAESRSALEGMFNNVMTLCAMVPLLVFTCLNSFLHSLVPQKVRVMGSLVVILLVFAVTAILVKVSLSPLPFFTVTMIKIVIINSFGAILQGSLFGMAGLLPEGYTTPIMSGQGLAGTFAASAMICAIASGSSMQDAAFGYFITACIVIFLTAMSYVLLPRMEFFQFYEPSKTSKNSVFETENTLDLMQKDHPAEGTALENPDTPRVSMLSIFKKIWVLALSVCFCFTVTIGTFPAVAADVKSSVAMGGAWEDYFTPVSCFLFFNLFDWAGRSFTALCMWPGKDSKLLPLLVALRCVFVPLFMLCNVQPRSSLPVLFEHDAWFLVFMVLFAFSNGFLASLCMCYGPKQVPRQEAETAGSIMAFFLSLGLALGAAFSFLFRGLV